MWDIMGWLKQFSDWQTAPLRLKIENQKAQLDAMFEENAKLRKQLPSIPVDIIPDSDVSMMSMQAMYALVAENKLALTYGGVLDEDYWYPKHDWWLKLMKDIVPKVPPWVKDRRDCDGFGVMMKGLVEFYYGFNACAIMDGELYVDYVPNEVPSWQAHDWFGFVSEKGLYSVERNGQIWQVGTRPFNYHEKRIYI